MKNSKGTKKVNQKNQSRSPNGRNSLKGSSARRVRRMRDHDKVLKSKWGHVAAEDLPMQPTKQTTKAAQLMININSLHHKTSTNKNTGMFRIVDSQSGKVTPELVNLFNS